MDFHVREISVVDKSTDHSRDYNPELWMFGRNDNWDSVAVRVNGFYPFIFIEGDFDEDEFTELVNGKFSEKIVSIEDHTRVKLAFFNYGKTTPVKKVSVKTPGVIGQIKKLVSEDVDFSHLKLYGDYKLDWADNFRQVSKIQPQTWVSIKYANRIHGCKAKHVFEVNYNNISRNLEKTSHKITKMIIRMRAISKKPVNANPEIDPIISLSAIVQRMGDDSNTFEMHESGDELNIIQSFVRFVHTHDPDIFFVCNDNYDVMNYIQKRINVYRPGAGDVVSRFNYKMLSKFNGREYMRHPGRSIVDLVCVLKKMFCKPSLDGTNLYNILERSDLCGMSLDEDELFDDPMTLCLMEKKLQESHAKNRTTKESKWLFELDSNRHMVLGEVEKCSVTYCDLTASVTAGQQVPLWKYLNFNAYNGGWLMNRDENKSIQPKRVPKESATYEHIDFNYLQKRPYKVNNKESLKGGWVANPLPGFYVDDYVSTQDFASLYPSIMIGYNICWQALICDESVLNDPDIETWSVDIGSVSVPFVKSYKGVKIKTLLPECERQLLEQRYNVKKQMKKSKDPFERAVLNAKQLGIKVVANALYGFTGVRNKYDADGNLTSEPYFASVDIMLSVTAMGRFQNKTLGTFVQTEYAKWGAEVLYGDSVAGYTSMLLRKDNVVHIMSIQSLWSGPDGDSTDKEYMDLDGYETWTEKGWTKIHRIMRHRTSKNMVRVTTHTGSVDVTEDHSLILEDLTPIKPSECKVGDKLLHSFPDSLPEHATDITEEEAEVMGHLLDSVPSEILCAPKNIRLAFWKAHSTRKEDDAIGFSENDQVGAMGLFTLAKSLGCQYVVGGLDTDPSSTDTAIKKLTSLGPCTGYVYDLTTENHHFQAGVGQIIVHNTDSVMIRLRNPPPVPEGEGTYEERKLKHMFALFDTIGEESSKLFPSPNEVENEYLAWRKIFTNMKKQYMGFVIEFVGQKPKFSASGFTFLTRAQCRFVRNACREIAELCITYGTTEDQIIERIHYYAEQLRDERVPYKLLALTSEMKELHEYSKDNYIQFRVAKKVEERTNRPTKGGSRLKYIVAKMNGRKLYESGEEFTYAVKHNVKPDYQYYIEQFKTTLNQFLIYIPGFENGNYGKRTRLDCILSETVGAIKRKSNGTRSIMSLFGKNSKKQKLK